MTKPVLDRRAEAVIDRGVLGREPVAETAFPGPLPTGDGLGAGRGGGRRTLAGRILLALLLAVAPWAALAAPPEAAEEEAAGEVAAGDTVDADGSTDREIVLPREFEQWLQEVDPIITSRERGAFVKLEKDYQRHAFIRRFWQSRDPYPETTRNELKDRWESRMELAKSAFGGLEDDRARVFLLHGRPDKTLEVRCTKTRVPAEVWVYEGSDYVDFSFLLLFVRPRGEGPARVYRPHADRRLRRVVANARSCLHGDQLTQVLSFVERAGSDYPVHLAQALAKPEPRSGEWIDTFAAHSTELPRQAETFDAGLSLSYPGRHDNRTVVQGVVSVPRPQAEVGEFAGHRSYDFLLNGEVVLDDQLFESFRYRFGFTASTDGAERPLPIAFQRYLRPGSYQLVVRIEDLNSGAFYRTERTLEVPATETVYEVASETDRETLEIFEEATADLASGEDRVRLVPPVGGLQAGFVRIDALTSGDAIDKIRFLLDGRRVLTRNRPPFTVEIDLGEFPRRHELLAEALGEDGGVVATDTLELNTGGNRFEVELLEPLEGKHYERSLRARAEVDVPDGSSLDRLELFLDETRVATLYQEPFAQPIPLPESSEISYVRAVAYLDDGNVTEDVVFVNAPDYLEEIDVQFVELYATVFDRQGHPLDGLQEEDFRVLEDGVEQEVTRFERVEDLPIHAGILIDTSGSMHDSLGQVRKAALRFLEQAITPRDRAAVITFNKFPRLAVKLTNDHTALGGGLAGLAPEGETALYDSLIFGLYYFTGIRGQRAILLLSDGKDESSQFSFEETLEYVRRAGVTIYTIGLELAAGRARSRLATLARETGGRSFFLGDVAGLRSIYETIQEELRSQYMLAYQSSNTEESESFRQVDLLVDDPEAEQINTISGYYP